VTDRSESGPFLTPAVLRSAIRDPRSAKRGLGRRCGVRRWLQSSFRISREDHRPSRKRNRYSRGFGPVFDAQSANRDPRVANSCAVRRSAFGVRRSAFGVRRSAFGVLRSAFCVLRSAFCVLRSAFCVLKEETGRPRVANVRLVSSKADGPRGPEGD